jgi:hypothetical protein
LESSGVTFKLFFNFILYSHSQLVTGVRDPDMIATVSLSKAIVDVNIS